MILVLNLLEGSNPEIWGKQVNRFQVYPKVYELIDFNIHVFTE